MARAALLALLLAPAARAAAPSAGTFGKVSFPVSCAPAAQASFDEALALLHSFWYEEAEKAFRRVAERDPGCAMAYWGAAMSRHHALWGSLDDEWIKAGREAATKARELGAKTERERRFITAIDAFYANDGLRDYGRRIAAFGEAMKPPFDADAKDVEAASFYGLALLAAGRREQAAGLLEEVLKRAPEHPGAIHYLIHACDTPALALRGLPAARRYAKLAPLAPHALHMPSHVFIRLGRWPDVIASNLESIRASRRAVALGMKGNASSDQLHAMAFLQYAYLQTGRAEDSLRLIRELDAMKDVDADRLAEARPAFLARHALERRDWAAAARLSAPEGAKPWTRRAVLWTRVVGAARAGDARSARADFEKFSALEDEAKAGYPWKRMQVEKLEARAWLSFAEGRTEEALETLRAAAREEGELESEQLAVPALEMLGDALLELKRPSESAAEYKAALALAPGRAGALEGLKRAGPAAARSR